MSTTAQSLALESLCDLGVIRPGETPSSTVLDDLLVRLNQFMASLSIEQLMAQTQVHGTYALIAGISRYTVGVGGAFGTAARPEKLTAWRAYSGNFQNGGLVGTFEELQAVSKDPVGSAATLPIAVGADTASPLINLGVFPIPGISPGTIELTYWVALTQFATLATVVSLPDGWEEMIRANFAIALLPRYARQGFDPTVLAALAQTTKAKIADLNRPAAPQAA